MKHANDQKEERIIVFAQVAMAAQVAVAGRGLQKHGQQKRKHSGLAHQHCERNAASLKPDYFCQIYQLS